MSSQFSAIYLTYKQSYEGFCIVFVQSRQYDIMIISIMSMVTHYFFPLSIALGNILFHAELLKNIAGHFLTIII